MKTKLEQFTAAIAEIKGINKNFKADCDLSRRLFAATALIDNISMVFINFWNCIPFQL